MHFLRDGLVEVVNGEMQLSGCMGSAVRELGGDVVVETNRQ